MMQADMADDRSIAGQIARTLAERIVSGALPPGQWLRQDHVAAEFRASHVPVREAFRRLAAQGLVTVEPRKGARVAPLDSSDVLEVAEMRAALEVLALRHAMPRMSGEALEAAHEAACPNSADTDIEALEENNRCFHRAIVTPCAMPRLLAAIADLHRASARHLFAAWRILNWRSRSDDEHRAILAAIQAGRGEEACTRLGAHIAAAGAALAEAMRHG